MTCLSRPVSLILEVLLLLSVLLCGSDSDQNIPKGGQGGGVIHEAELVETINENSDLPVDYMSLSPQYGSEEMEALEQTYEVIHNFMSIDFYGEDLAFFYYGYPTDESSFCLAQIRLLTDRYNILGVTIGSDIRQAVEILRLYGFEGTPQFDETYGYAVLSCGNFTITMQSREGYTVTGFEISAASTYLGNRIY